MSIKKDNVSVTAVKYNSQDVNKVILDNKCVWCKPFTYTQGTLPTGVASLTCTRSSTDEPTASTGTIANGGTIYYDDKLYWAATASTGYRITAVKGSNSPVTVSGAITGTTASGLTSARISGTISQGKLPIGVASIKCYRKAYNGSSFAEYTGTTIYYGDQFYWTATATIEYTNPSLTYNSSSKVYTWTGSQGDSINSVKASGLSAGVRKSFWINFGITANKTLYGSWSIGGIKAEYGDKITVSDNSVTCYTWYNTSTIRWTATVTSYPNDAQYTYSAVTIIGSDIASVTAETKFTAWNTRTLNSYTITWKYLSAYPDTWTTETQTYDYGATPSKTVSNVTSGSFRKVPTSWDNLDTVTGNRTITANYKTQVYITWSGTRCSMKINGKQPTTMWRDIGDIITWTADPNCAFSSDGFTTTISEEISTQKTNYTASADYINVTSVSGTNCTAYTDSNCTTPFTTGWYYYTTRIYWKASKAYTFDAITNRETADFLASPGANTAQPEYVKHYKLIILVTNASYGTYSVSRTKSPYQGATTGALSDGDTIYYGDVLTGTSSAKAASYDDWSVTSVTAPTFTTTGDATSGNLTITNKSSSSATLYYNTSNAVGGTSVGTAAANASKTVSGLSFNKQYYISARVSRTRTKHTYATDGDQYSGTNGVTDNVWATFAFKDTTSTETGTIDSSVVAAKTAPQNKYTVTFSIRSGEYGSWSTTSIANVPYGTAITRSGNTVTIGNLGSSTFTPPSTTVQYNYANPTFNASSSVTGTTTVTGGCVRSNRVYTIQWIGADGSTVLETDSNVAYNAVLTYNGSTPSKPSTAQYNYTFSVWKLGSTSGSTVTSGTTTNAGSTSSTTIKIYSTFTSTVRSYTITWKYMSDYNSWTTATQSYNYGATPSRTLPSSNIYSDDKRYLPLKWDDLSKVTDNRTITCTYKHQIYYRYNEINCGYFSGTTAGWYDGTSLSYSTTFTSNSGYAFDDRGNTTKTYSGTTNGNHSDTVVAQPSYIKITASSSNTSCFLSTSSVGIPGKTYIWVTSGSTVYAYAKLKSFVSSVPSTWSLQSGTALCPDAIYSVSYDTYYSPTTINYSATITTGRFWCAHKERQETSFSAVAYSTSQNFNGARWTDSYYSVNNSLNVYATCAFARSKSVSQSNTLWPYSTSFHINGPITATFRAEYTEMRSGLAYKTPEYILYKVSPDGTMTNSVVDANKTKDLTADYLWVLTIERPAGKSDDTATTT